MNLSDTSWATGTNGWGPVEHDTSNGEASAGDGRPMSIGGRSYTKGFGVNPYSEITYSLNGECSTFSADVGIDDEVGSDGSAVFQVLGDSTKLAESPILRGGSQPFSITADLTGYSSLRLIVLDAGDGGWQDHADWGNPTLLCR